MSSPFRIVPYARARHADGGISVVSAVFDEYGFPFAESDYDANVMRPDLHYDGQTGWFWVAEDESGEAAGCVGLSDEGGGEFELHRLYVLSSARVTDSASNSAPWSSRGRRSAAPAAWCSSVTCTSRTPMRSTNAWACARIASVTRQTHGRVVSGALWDRVPAERKV